MADENTITDETGDALMSLEECAALDFEPWPGDLIEKIPTNREWANLANPHLVAVRLALTLLAKSKAELVKIADGDDTPDTLERLLDHLDRSARWYREAVEIISSARARLLSAASVVALRDAA